MDERVEVHVRWNTTEFHDVYMPLEDWEAIKDDPENGLAEYEAGDTLSGVERTVEESREEFNG